MPPPTDNDGIDRPLSTSTTRAPAARTPARSPTARSAARIFRDSVAGAGYVGAINMGVRRS